MTIAYPSNQSLQTPLTVSPPSGAPRPRLTFLGTGYLGATYAICFAEMGYDVLGFDIDEAKIANLAKVVAENKDKAKTLDELKVAVPIVSKACGDCHEPYRRPAPPQQQPQQPPPR